jgi:hypothetical protein
VVMYEAVGVVLYSGAYDGLVSPFLQNYLSLGRLCLCCFSSVLHKDHVMVTESWELVLHLTSGGLFVMKRSSLLLPLVVKPTICSNDQMNCRISCQACTG